MVHQRQTVPHEHEEPDSWHRHTPAEGAPQREHGSKANPAVLGVAFVLSVALVGGVILATVVYFRRHVTELRKERIETTVLAGDFLKYRGESEAHLAGYSWASDDAAREGKNVSIPIEEAKKRVLEKYAKQGK
jgi:hypothetical protein